MIKINRTAAPIKLTTALAANLTSKYALNTNDPVWRLDFIKDALMQMVNNKCAYCETKLDELAIYMEVEHFFCKKKHPLKVVDWANLFPACKRCNVQKGDHDVAVDGNIVSPDVDIPSAHIRMKGNYRFEHLDDKGNQTIEAIYLNDSDRLVKKRFEIGEEINNTVESLRVDVLKYESGPSTTQLRNRITRGLASLLREASPTSAFSACAATCILRNSDYVYVRDRLQALSLWNAEHIAAELVAQAAALL